MALWYVLALSFLTDLAVGDPRSFVHPVEIMGALVARLESVLRRQALPVLQVTSGFLLWLVVVGASYGVTWALVSAASGINQGFGLIAEIWLISTTIAARGLADSARRVEAALKAGDLSAARHLVGRIVGRDTLQMDEPEVVRATLESVAENSVDGVVSPVFYALIGGAPLAMAYRAINTMDSMLGHKDDKYLYFGRAAARLDDLANFVPARLTGVMMCLAAALLGRDWRAAWRCWMRDAGKHQSPNSGVPEACAAGALGLLFGGLNYYDGEPEMRARMGERTREFGVPDIDVMVRLMLLTSALAVLFACVCSVALGL